MVFLPRSVRATWVLAALAWAAGCVAAWWALPARPRFVVPRVSAFAAAFDPRGRWFAVCPTGIDGVPGPLQIRDVRDGRPLALLRGDPPRCYDILPAPDGRWLLTAECDRHGAPVARRLYDADTGEALGAVPEPGKHRDGQAAFAPAASPHGPFLAYADKLDGGARVRFLELPSLRPFATLDGAEPPLAFSPDGRYLATGLWGSHDEPSAGLWDVGTGRRMAQFGDANGRRRPAAFAASPDGRLVAVDWQTPPYVSRFWPARVEVRDQATGTRRFEREDARLVGFADTGRPLVVIREGDNATSAARWLRGLDAETEAERWARACPADGGFTDDLTASAGGGRVAAVAEQTPSLVEQWVVRNRLPVPWTVDQFGRSVQVYDAASGRPVGRVPGTAKPRLAADGQVLAVERDGRDLEVWDVPPRKPLTWFLPLAAVLALPPAWLARRRVARLRRLPEPPYG
jgi:WD40 repeat protein